MNRDRRRAHRRGALADLRRHGCTCRPQMLEVPGIDTPSGPTGIGYAVQHQAGCPLGSIFVDANRAGRTPIVLVQGAPWGCER